MRLFFNPDRLNAAAQALADQGRPGLDPRILDRACRDNPQLYVDGVRQGWTGNVCDRLYQAVTRIMLTTDELANPVHQNPAGLHQKLLDVQRIWLAAYQTAVDRGFITDRGVTDAGWRELGKSTRLRADTTPDADPILLAPFIRATDVEPFTPDLDWDGSPNRPTEGA